MRKTRNEIHSGNPIVKKRKGVYLSALVAIFLVFIAGFAWLEVVDRGRPRAHAGESRTVQPDQRAKTASLEMHFQKGGREGTTRTEFTPDTGFHVREGDTLWEIAGSRSVYGDPYLWKQLVMNNRDRVRQVLYDDETEKWIAHVDPGVLLNIEKAGEVDTVSAGQFDTARYMLQLKAFGPGGLGKAKDLVRYLVRTGYCAYVYQDPLSIGRSANNQASRLYRIRLGFFSAAGHASSAGNEILSWIGDSLQMPDFMVLPVPGDELDGRGVLFGIQRNAPWIVEISKNRNYKKTLDLYRRIRNTGAFTYIRKHLQPLDGYVYSVRLGYYHSQMSARRILAKIRRVTDRQYRRAKIIELFNPSELSPGQNRGNIF